MPWVIFLALGTWLLSFPAADPDLWWHLAAGRDLWNGHFPWRDRLCSDTFGRPWIDLQWGFQAILWQFWKVWGASGAVTLKALGMTAAAIIASQRRGRLGWWSALLGIAALFVAREAVDVRPLVLTLPLLCLEWTLLEAWMRKPSRSLVAAILLSQMAMANVQGVHALGPVTAGILLFFDESPHAPALRRKGLLVAAIALASLATPWPLSGILLPWRLSVRMLPGIRGTWSLVSENAPLLSVNRARPLLFWGTLWALFAALATQEFGGRNRARLLLCLALAALALASLRNVPLLVLASLFSVVRSLPHLRRNLRRQVRAPRLRRWGTGLLLFSGFAVVVAARYRDTAWEAPIKQIAPLAFPENVPELATIPPTSLYHPLEWGGWLGFHFGAASCHGDTRLVLRGRAALEQELQRTADTSAWELWSNSHGIDWALLPVWNAPRYHLLLAHLMASRQWNLVRLDGASALFSRHSEPTDTLPPAWLLRKFSPRLRRRTLLENARMLASCGHFRLAVLWAQEAEQ